MMLHFSHSHKRCSAYAVYDQCDSKKLLTVYNLDYNGELGYKIIFYPNEEKKWITNHPIRSKFPSTYSNLCKNLATAFAKNEFTFVE